MKRPKSKVVDLDQKRRARKTVTTVRVCRRGHDLLISFDRERPGRRVTDFTLYQLPRAEALALAQEILRELGERHLFEVKKS